MVRASRNMSLAGLAPCCDRTLGLVPPFRQEIRSCKAGLKPVQRHYTVNTCSKVLVSTFLHFYKMSPVLKNIAMMGTYEGKRVEGRGRR